MLIFKEKRCTFYDYALLANIILNHFSGLALIKHNVVMAAFTNELCL